MNCYVCGMHSDAVCKVIYGDKQSHARMDVMHCTNCGHAFLYGGETNCQPSFDGYFENMKTVHLYKDSFDRKHLRNVARLFLIQLFHNFSPGDCVLEIGPGYDGIFCELRRSGHSLRCTAFEPSHNAVPRLKELGVTVFNQEFTSESCALLSDKYNVVIANQILYYIDDPLLFLENVKSLCSVGSLVQIEVSNTNMDILYSLERTIHKHFFTKESLRQLAVKAGYKVEYLDTCGATFDEMKLKVYPSTPYDTGYFSSSINRKISTVLDSLGLSAHRCFSPALAVARNPEFRYGGEDRHNIRALLRV